MRQPPHAHGGLTQCEQYVMFLQRKEQSCRVQQTSVLFCSSLPSCQPAAWGLLESHFSCAKKLPTVVFTSLLLKMKRFYMRSSWWCFPTYLSWEVNRASCQLFNYYDIKVCNVLEFIPLLTTNDTSESLIRRQSKGRK